MTAAQFAFSLPADLLRQAKKAVATGRAKSSRPFVIEALDEKLRRPAFSGTLDKMDAEHGKPSKGDRAWAKRVLKPSA